ncbi:sll1863 family stress response protein [Flavobacterium aquicola]|uniref:Uncharacterized protein n=1 Tax=Flavobacterium aquicola TaxID=1682742 RepID=A0A3E0ES66_9FLAO|nr:hypothetical protein [Flavobacterium aquicola]REH00501.1 hypothetical protein C8P67_103487 [Flavobacterium aquicola]
MKKIISILLISAFSTALFVSCKPSTKEEEAAQENVEEAKENVQQAKEDLAVAKEEANAEEWESFKKNVDTIIEKNDAKIEVLQQNIKKSGKKASAEYQKKVDALQEKNEELKVKIKTYKNDAHSDWQSFKREFNHDMDEIGNAFKDLTVDNKN